MFAKIFLKEFCIVVSLSDVDYLKDFRKVNYKGLIKYTKGLIQKLKNKNDDRINISSGFNLMTLFIVKFSLLKGGIT